MRVSCGTGFSDSRHRELGLLALRTWQAGFLLPTFPFSRCPLSLLPHFAFAHFPICPFPRLPSEGCVAPWIVLVEERLHAGG